MQSILIDIFLEIGRLYVFFLFIFTLIITSSPVYDFFPSFHTGNIMIALYALGVDVSSDVY